MLKYLHHVNLKYITSSLVKEIHLQRKETSRVRLNIQMSELGVEVGSVLAEYAEKQAESYGLVIRKVKSHHR